MSTDHRKPVLAFIVLALAAAVLVGVQRADAHAGRMLAAAIGTTVRVHGTVPTLGGSTELARQGAAIGPTLEELATESARTPLALVSRAIFGDSPERPSVTGAVTESAPVTESAAGALAAALGDVSRGHDVADARRHGRRTGDTFGREAKRAEAPGSAHKKAGLDRSEKAQWRADERGPRELRKLRRAERIAERKAARVQHGATSREVAAVRGKVATGRHGERAAKGR